MMEVNITLSNEENAEEIMAIKPLNKISKCFEMETIFSTKTAQLLCDIPPEENYAELMIIYYNLLKDTYMDIVA